MLFLLRSMKNETSQLLNLMLLSKYEVESAFTIRDLQLSDLNFWGTWKGKDLQPDTSLFVITVFIIHELMYTS